LIPCHLILAPGQRGSELTNALRSALPTTIAGRAVVARADLRTGETHGDWGSTAWDLPASDVLVFLLDDQTRVIARPSGTEPKVKFYYEVIEAVDGEPVADVRERANARLADLVARHAEVHRARVVATRSGEKDVMTVQIETRAANPALYEETVLSTLKLKGLVELVPPGSLPNDGLVIEDQRRYD
jgi:hypothetical protein